LVLVLVGFRWLRVGVYAVHVGEGLAREIHPMTPHVTMVLGIRAVATQFGVRVDQGVGTEDKIPVGSVFQLVLVVGSDAVQHDEDGVVQVAGGVHGDAHIRLSTRVLYIVMAVQTLYHEFQSVSSEDIHLDAANKSVEGFGFWSSVDMFPVEIAINPSGHSLDYTNIVLRGLCID
jgi:hypothetical protein